MDSIKAVLFEPVGCLAEFSAEEFTRAATELFGVSEETAGGSQAYWRLIGLMNRQPVAAETLVRLQAFELRAAEQAELYEDVHAALAELNALGVAAHLASSLSRAAVARFLARHSLSDAFAGVVTRDEAHGLMASVLRATVERAGVAPPQIMALADTAEALELIKQQGLNAMLMINDYDEGRALAERHPAGGIVSLAELPDALRLIAQRSGLHTTARAPRAPFELFDPT
ncbi:MAG TPA: HAD hydrolase-like protein [Xanthobacteraceae bacterium]